MMAREAEDSNEKLPVGPTLPREIALPCVPRSIVAKGLGFEFLRPLVELD